MLAGEAEEEEKGERGELEGERRRERAVGMVRKMMRRRYGRNMKYL